MQETKVIFNRKYLIKLVLPLVVEQILAVTVGMADMIMVSGAGDTAVSGVSLVNTISNLLIYVFNALATGGAVVASQALGAKKKETGKIVTVEEHSVIGGLGSAVCEVLCEKYPTPVLRVGIQDVFGESGSAVKLLEKYKLDGQGVYEQVKEWLA